MTRGRLATLVVVDRTGTIRGATEPLSVDLPLAMIDALVAIQWAGTDRVAELVERGVPDLREERLIDALGDLVDRVAPGRAPLVELVADLPDRLADAAACGVPDTIVHGDPHGGNCRTGVLPPVWFDWGDSFVGNPLLDLAALHRMRPAAVERWLQRWAEVVPGSDPATAWSALEPVAALRQGWVYQRFLDNIEPAERIYHRDDVAGALAEVEALLASR